MKICCPKCRVEFRDRKGEHALLDDHGKIVNYDRYYVCPTCKTVIDILHGKPRS